MQGDMDKATTMLAIAVNKARDGVDYDAKYGAACPFCGERARVTHTLQWLDRSRKRYHKCHNIRCPLHVIDETICSWQDV